LYKKLESLRGIAAILVVLYHSPFNYHTLPFNFFNNSYLFVDFFFILSGFVMAFAYANKINEGMSFKKYLLLRLGRLYPLHIFTLLLWIPYVVVKQYYFSIGAVDHNQLSTSNFYSLFTNVFLIHSLGFHTHLSWNYPSWSISTEFFTYIIFFFTLKLVDKNRNIIIPLTISGLSYLFILNLDYPNLDITFDFGLMRCIAGFFLGIAIFRLLKFNKISTFFNNNVIFFEIVSVLFIIISVSFSYSKDFFLFLVPISFGLTIATFSSHSSGYFGSFLEKKIPRQIGMQSYSIYMVMSIIVSVLSNFLTHVMKINLKQEFGYTSVLLNFLIIIIILFVSKYTYELIETKFRDLSKLYVKKLD
jgi:peptidoglycan/LPS O-acetylase OafA/YrhL